MAKINWERWKKIGDFLRSSGGKALTAEDSFSEEEVQYINDVLATMEHSIFGLEDIILLAKNRSKDPST